MAPDAERIGVTTQMPYDVVVGHRLLDELPAMVGPAAERVAVVHAEALAGVAGEVERALDGRRVLLVPVPDGEAAKTATVVARCWDRLGEAGFTRSDAVVTVGGGATTDLGGFVAATWLRGVPVVHVPTSLLAMVDAAVGGKTGIDTAAGKNLVGSFHEPTGVLCDLDLLGTLPAAELASGLAEVLKCGFVADPEILRTVEAAPDAVLDPRSAALREVAERAVRVKAEVVAGDLREAGGRSGRPGREALNYGHTLAHALERASGFRLRHGEAVAVGMVYVAALAHRLHRIDEGLAARHSAVLEAVGLPTDVQALGMGGVRFDDLLAAMRVDKKARGSLLRLVVLDGLASPAILEGPSEEDLRAAWEVVAR